MSGRIRSIKPEVLEDEVASALSDAAWRLWVSSWVLADDHGNLRLGERYLAANVWQDTGRDVATPLFELLAVGLIEHYSAQGQRYGHIKGWKRHQRVDNAGNPRVPTPEEDDGTWNQELRERLSTVRGKLPRNSASVGGLPLARQARAQSGGETTTPITDPDHRSPTGTVEPPPQAEPAVRGRTSKQDSKGTRIASDWKPTTETLEAFRQTGVDAAACVAEFVDYWVALPGVRGRKLDWEATFRNRVRQLVEDGRAPAWRESRATPVTPARRELSDEDRAAAADVEATLPGILDKLSDAAKPKFLREVDLAAGADVRWTPPVPGSAT